MELAEDVEMEEKRRAERGAEREKRPFIHKSHSDIKDSFCWSQLQAGGRGSAPDWVECPPACYPYHPNM